MHPQTPAFGSRTLRFFGRHSYALYVFHQPIAVLLSTLGLSALTRSLGASELVSEMAFAAAAFAISLVAALLSWNLYEKHFLKLKDRFRHDDDTVPVIRGAFNPDRRRAVVPDVLSAQLRWPAG